MKAVMIGAGNVATNLVRALAAAGVEVVQVYSRTLPHARELAATVGACASDSLDGVVRDADIYIISVSDDAIAGVVEAVPDNGAVWVHTSGSTSVTVFAGRRERYGVFYPMQSFSKQIAADFADVPFFIEAESEATAVMVEGLARQLSRRVFRATSDQRRRLHIAAVFACNFANHMWTLAGDVLGEAGLPFDVMLPLINTTVDKLKLLPPAESQTGPAVRHDVNVMHSHIAMLDEEKAAIYKILSDSIIKRHEQN